ncbi:Hypothetical predicted protein [Olea europaea subsp. europaea]|uniref:Uncharacterized protein n=1 Tax=Olea europaea subsp. europaea TaxID=158383 RepID=A0A8S0Q4Z5_OLEEU|nr:Hypothetical predicted protein [Olea europaea subsp. europaea]
MHIQTSEWRLAFVFNSSSAYARLPAAKALLRCCSNCLNNTPKPWLRGSQNKHWREDGWVSASAHLFRRFGVVEWVTSIERREASIERREGGDEIGFDIWEK